MPTTNFDVVETAAGSSTGVSAVNHSLLIVSQIFVEGMGHHTEPVWCRFVDTFMAVPSFDDIPVASNLTLTFKTVHQPTYKLDSQATRVALNMVKEE